MCFKMFMTCMMRYVNGGGGGGLIDTGGLIDIGLVREGGLFEREVKWTE